MADTYGSWLAKEVGKGRHHAVSKQVSSTVSADTFQEWMKKQPVKEIVESSEPVRVSNTYDDWMVKQVAERQAQSEVQTTQIQTVEDTTTDIVVKPASNLVNPERPKEEGAS